MSIFNYLPNNFFSILSSPNKEIYADAVLLLGELFKYDINVPLDDYIVRLISLIDDRDYISEEDDDDRQTSTLSSNQKARLIVNKLIKTGWIEKEYREGTFTETIALYDRSIKTIKLLEALANPRTKEYNSLVFATYSSLKQARSEEAFRMYDALLSAKENTDRLVDELKSLYHSIRDYHRSISEANSFNELLKGHFDDYKQMIDKIYHPIKTMDSIFRYSGPIKDLLMGILSDDLILEAMAKRAMTVKFFDNIQIAHESIRLDIDFILEAYNSISGIVNQIDRKHAAYTRNSIEKMQYLLTADRSIKGKLVAILNAVGTCKTSKQDEDLCDLLQKNIRLDRQEFFDGNSLYHKNVRSRRVYSDPVEVEKIDFSTDEVQKIVNNHLAGAYSTNRIKAYVAALLEGKKALNIKDIQCEEDCDFILLMLSAIRGGERDMPYLVEIGANGIEINDYSFPEMTFVKKGV